LKCYIQNKPNRIVIQGHVPEMLRGLRPREAAFEAVGSNCAGPDDVAAPPPEPPVGVPTRELCLDPPLEASPEEPVPGEPTPDEPAPDEPVPEGPAPDPAPEGPAPEEFPSAELSPDEPPPAVFAAAEGLARLAAFDDCAAGLLAAMSDPAAIVPEATGEAAEAADERAGLPAVFLDEAPDPADDAAEAADERAELAKVTAELATRVAVVIAGAAEVTMLGCAMPLPEADPPAPPIAPMMLQKSRNC
jgi:hypothetical protein